MTEVAKVPRGEGDSAAQEPARQRVHEAMERLRHWRSFFISLFATSFLLIVVVGVLAVAADRLLSLVAEMSDERTLGVILERTLDVLLEALGNALAVTALMVIGALFVAAKRFRGWRYAIFHTVIALLLSPLLFLGVFVVPLLVSRDFDLEASASATSSPASSEAVSAPNVPPVPGAS